MGTGPETRLGSRRIPGPGEGVGRWVCLMALLQAETGPNRQGGRARGALRRYIPSMKVPIT